MGGGGYAKRWHYSISLFSKKGSKILKIWVTSFMDGPIWKLFSPLSNFHQRTFFFWCVVVALVWRGKNLLSFSLVKSKFDFHILFWIIFFFLVSGVSLDNLSTPKPPDYVPPFTIFAPWCFRSLQMQPEDTFQRGRLYALRLLCMATGKQTADI